MQIDRFGGFFKWFGRERLTRWWRAYCQFAGVACLIVALLAGIYTAKSALGMNLLHYGGLHDLAYCLDATILKPIPFWKRDYEHRGVKGL